MGLEQSTSLRYLCSKHMVRLS